MRRILEIGRSATLWAGSILIFGYWAVAPYVPANEMAEWLRASQAVISVFVALAYLPSLIEILAARLPSQAQQLVLGIVMAWTGAAGNASWFLLWRLAGRPEWMLTAAPINGWFVWLMVLGGFLHLTAPRSIEGRFPRSNWVWLGAAVFMILLLAGFLALSPPDARGVAEWLKPYLS